jgi:hypothetical protein
MKRAMISHIDMQDDHIDTVISHIDTVISRSSSISILSSSVSILSLEGHLHVDTVIMSSCRQGENIISAYSGLMVRFCGTNTFDFRSGYEQVQYQVRRSSSSGKIKLINI